MSTRSLPIIDSPITKSEVFAVGPDKLASVIDGEDGSVLSDEGSVANS